MAPIEAIINAFGTLRQRGVKDPVYCRLVLKTDDGRRIVAWLWRSPHRQGYDLETYNERTRDEFTLSFQGKPGDPPSQVTIRWLPPFKAAFGGSQKDIKRTLWFLHQGPKVSGGTHVSIDNFQCGSADWSLATSDVFLVRCGSYEKGWRKPSKEAMDWVKDPNRFLVDDWTRQRTLEALQTQLATGERVTIRRVFNPKDSED